MIDENLEVDNCGTKRCNSSYNCKKFILDAQLKEDIVALLSGINTLLFTVFVNFFVNIRLLSVLLVCYVIYCLRCVMLDFKRIRTLNVNCNCEK